MSETWTLLDHLNDHAARRPDAVALRDSDGAVSFAELVGLVGAGAGLLASAGVRAGDRVLIQGPNSIAVALAYFAAHAAGAIAVPVDPDLSAESLRVVLEECTPTRLVRGGKVAALDASAPPVLALDAFGTLAPGAAPRPRGPAEPADILFTTGTTGRPRGVLLTHANITAAARQISAFMRQEPSDVEVVPVPFSHSFGVGRLRCMAFTGNAVVPLPGIRFPAQLAEALERYEATGLAVVPAVMALLRRAAPEGVPELARLRYVEFLSAPFSDDVRAWVLAQMPRTRLIHAYGLTEASRSAYVELGADKARRGSIGEPSPGVRMEVRRADGSRAADGEEGEIWVQAGTVMRGYWGRPEATAAALVDGWLRTGDLGVMDAEGSFFLRGRASEMINVGGMKVAPADVERFLLEHPDVVDAVCVGIPDPNGISGQRVKAYVCGPAPIPTAALVSWLRGRGLEAYKVPVAVEQVAAIPRTSSGKALRRLL